MISVEDFAPRLLRTAEAFGAGPATVEILQELFGLGVDIIKDFSDPLAALRALRKNKNWASSLKEEIDYRIKAKFGQPG